jgi:alanine or glycine:cation symporter, AGCS family
MIYKINRKGLEVMLATIESINNVVNNFIWGVPAMICIVGVGLLLSIRTGFLQIRKFPYAMKVTIGRMLKKREASDGALTPFQAVCTALAATVGTGNIAGVAGAIAIGGPGAVFWMWISALLGMCTKFSEVTLAVHFREKNAEGDLVGGPMYYIKNGLKKQWHWLAYLFAAFGVLTVFGTGNATQVNTITTAIDSALYNYGVISEQNVSTLNLVIGIILAVLIGLILLGGIKRIGQVAEKLVPFMAVIYIILAIGVVILNYRNIPTVFASIFKGAFSPASVTGGAVGSFFMSMKKGVSRGIFSNEAGLGTGSIAHACADTRKPVKQGFFGIFEVFVDTIVICTLTALVILCSGVPVGYGDAAGAELTILGFTSTYGSWVSIFTAIAMCCFAFSTIIGWGLYGTRCVEFLLGTRANRPFMIVYALVAIVGATMELGLMWNIAETFNGLMVIPNLIAVFLLSGVVVRLVKEYFDREGKNV